MTPTQKTPSIIGGILLVIGNVIGAGILALPIAIAQIGFWGAVFVLFFFWALMTFGAYYFLEANLALPAGSHLISMSKAAFGKWGVVAAWVCNLLVMYSLIAAYIAGGGDLIKTNLAYLHITFSAWIYPLIFLGIFALIVSLGIHVTDHANRFFMLMKAALFLIVIAGLAPHFNVSALFLVLPEQNLSASLLIIVVTSFGFATLIPSLRCYYQSDVKKIKKIIAWGTLIPLLCYLTWIAFIFSVIPYEGQYGLKNMHASVHPVSDLQFSLNQFLQITWLTQATNFFSAICIATSFLANAISLTHFIDDGLCMPKSYKKSGLVYFLAYFPALFAVLFCQKAFLWGLSVAGTVAIIQLLILPGMIVWFLRDASQKNALSYSVIGGKLLLGLWLAISVIVLFVVVLG